MTNPRRGAAAGTRAAFLTSALAVLLAVGAGISRAAEPSVTLKEVRIGGNLRVEEDGIWLHIKAKAGQPFDLAVVEQDVRSIFRMGYFDDVKADLSPEGVLTYVVAERPYVREVRVSGNVQITRERIESAFGVVPRTILDREKVIDGVEKVRKLYSEQGYVNAEVQHSISVVENNQAVIQVAVDEGNRLLVERVSFEGNRAFSSAELRGLIGTKEKWFLSFVTNRGVLDREVLTNDLAILATHYYDHGYVNHKIDEPVIVRRRDGIEVVFRVDEGEQYRVGRVEIGGDLIEEGEKLLERVQLTEGQIFRGRRLREDVETLSNLYADKGFAFARVEPLTKVDPEKKSVDVALVVKRGQPVHFNRILISGNTRTIDKVIRRELTVSEQESFSAKQLRGSRNALQRTGYFEDVQITTKKVDRPDAVDLLVDVKEAPTGTFSIGGGYSSGDQFVFSTSVAERNLFGRGQRLRASVDLGSLRQDFVLSFTEPYLFDTPLSLTTDLFNTEQEFNDFVSAKTGFGVRTEYPLKRLDLAMFRRPREEVERDGGPPYRPFLEHLRGGIGYDITQEEIFDVDAGAPASIRDEKGTSLTSAVTPSLSYDSRDHFFNPTEGMLSSLTLKFAGLGGDNRFLKSDAAARWFYPVLKDPAWGGAYTVSLAGRLGYGVGFTERAGGKKNLPLFERYFPGGINSVRGFASRSLGPREGNDVVGGDRQAIFNAELLFPILDQYGLRGVAFFDTGQAFAESEKINLGKFRRSVGVGARWLSPFGPLRVELGFPLNKKSGDDTSVIGFSVGGLQ